MPTETEFAQSPDALAARARLDERLARVSVEERDAFWEAVRRCYAPPREDEDQA